MRKQWIPGPFFPPPTESLGTRLDCGILELIEPGDSIMADKGFDITYDVLLCGANLNIPPFLKDC